MPPLFIALKPDYHKKRVGTLGVVMVRRAVPSLPSPSSTSSSFFQDFCVETHSDYVTTNNVPQGMCLPLRTISIGEEILGALD